MIWASWQDFFFMGGYALYVWGSVLVCLLCVIGELVALRLYWHSLRQSVARRWQMARTDAGTEAGTEAGMNLGRQSGTQAGSVARAGEVA
jgi:heme exporter protein D